MTSDRSCWEKETNRQVEEERENHESNRIKAIEKYESDLQEWKEMHSKFVLADPKNFVFTR